MDNFQIAVKLKFWLYTKVRLGVYRKSIPRKLMRFAISLESNSTELTPGEQNIYFKNEWLEELNSCYKYGGYKNLLGKFYWSHTKFSYFDFKNKVFDGVPPLIKSADILLLKNIEYFPRALRPNEVSKYMFKVKKYESTNFDFEHAISFDVGGADSFQHFVQDCLPIINMSKDFLTSNKSLVMLLPPSNTNFRSRKELIQTLGITNEIIETDGDSIRIKNFYFWNFEPFNAKYVLPIGWELNLFHAFRHVNRNGLQNQIILITRNEMTRNFANLDLIQRSLGDLATELNLDFKIIDSSTAKLSDYRLHLPKAKIVVSMHGGANYNLIFCSDKTLFFEFIPTKETNTLINFFRFSGITYIPVPIDFRFKQSEDVLIPKNKLKDIQSTAKFWINKNL